MSLRNERFHPRSNSTAADPPSSPPTTRAPWTWVKNTGGATPAVTWAPVEGPGEGRRLDYCFVGAPLAERVRRAWADEEAQGSDHYPYWVEIDL